MACLIFLAYGALAGEVQKPVSEKSVAGYWKFEHSEAGMHISTVTSYLPDGAYTDEGTISGGVGVDRLEIPLTLAGGWKMEGDTLIIMIAESNAPLLYPKGKVFRSKVVSADAKEMIFISEDDGKRYKARRLARKPDKSQINL